MPPIPIYEQSIQTQDQRVLDRRSEIRWWEKPLEVVKTYPRASQDTGFRIVPPEGQLNTVHGNVAENKGQHHTRHTEQPERQISLESSDRTAFLFHFGLIWFAFMCFSSFMDLCCFCNCPPAPYSVKWTLWTFLFCILFSKYIVLYNVTNPVYIFCGLLGLLLFLF